MFEGKVDFERLKSFEKNSLSSTGCRLTKFRRIGSRYLWYIRGNGSTSR